MCVMIKQSNVAHANLYDSIFEVADGSPLFSNDREPVEYLSTCLSVILQTAMYVLS